MRLLKLLFGALESLGRLDLFTVGTCAEGLNADVDAYRLGLANACRRYGFGEAVLVSLDHPLLSSKMSSIFRRRRCVSAKALSQWPRAVLI